MISIYKTDAIKTNEDGETVIYGELRGNSTDTKPSDTFKGKIIGNGSVFIEIDTQKILFFDAENEQWKEV